MKKKLTLFLSMGACVVLLNSCGVMFGGSKYQAQIVAKDHANAEIYVDGQKLGNGEATGLFPRNRPLNVELKQEGCPPQTQTFNNTFRTGNFVLSLISWGLVGVAVDLGTGASYKPDHVNNPNIKRLSDKNFVFTVDYSGCKQ